MRSDRVFRVTQAKRRRFPNRSRTGMAASGDRARSGFGRRRASIDCVHGSVSNSTGHGRGRGANRGFAQETSQARAHSSRGVNERSRDSRAASRWCRRAVKARRTSSSTLHERAPNVEVIFFETRVQGVGAEVDIADAIDRAARSELDAIVALRGAGSFTDLLPFNTEPVVRAILRSRHPVITAIGHTGDHHLADAVADAVFKTPTAAAEHIVASWVRVADQLAALGVRLSRGDGQPRRPPRPAGRRGKRSARPRRIAVFRREDARACGISRSVSTGRIRSACSRSGANVSPEPPARSMLRSRA